LLGCQQLVLEILPFPTSSQKTKKHKSPTTKQLPLGGISRCVKKILKRFENFLKIIQKIENSQHFADKKTRIDKFFTKIFLKFEISASN